MPKATGLNGGASSPQAPSCATGTPSRSGTVAGVADAKQVGRRIKCALNRILNTQRFRDGRFAASLAKVTAPDRDIVRKPKPRRHVGGV
jgi:hypothetical protein